MIYIKKNGVVTNGGPDQDWLDRHIAMGTFGPPRWSTQSVETSPAVLDAEGNEISPSVREDQQVEDPNGFEIEVE